MTSDTPILIMTCGPTGTGKSTLMAKLSRATDFHITIISSDVVRKELAGIDPEEHHFEPFGKGIYSEEGTKRTYEEMTRRAAGLLSKGRSTVLDGCFLKRWQRDLGRSAIEGSDARFICVEFRVPEDVVKERLRKRMDGGEGASDGRWEIFLGQMKEFEPVDEMSDDEHMVVVETEEAYSIIIGAIGDR